jgi:hypothetical protein
VSDSPKELFREFRWLSETAGNFFDAMKALSIIMSPSWKQEVGGKYF